MGRFDEIVKAQYGMLLTAQGIDLLGRGGFEGRVRTGDLLREQRSLYRVAGAPKSDEQELFGATLLYGGYAGFKAAAWLHDFDRYRSFSLELVVPYGTNTRRNDKRQIAIHRSTYLPASHVEQVRGIPTTTAARTAFDLSTFLGTWSYSKLIDDAVRRKLLTYEALHDCRSDLRARGRRRSTVVDQFLETRGFGFDPGGSDPELQLGEWLADGIGPAVPQHPLVINGKRRLLDYAYPEYKVAAEYVGLDPHGMPVRVIDDSDRTTELQLAGWFVALITKKTGKAKAVRQIKDALKARGWTPS